MQTLTKKLLSLLAFTLPLAGLFAQPALGFDSTAVAEIWPDDTAHFGEKVRFDLVVENKGDVTFNGDLDIWLDTPGGSPFKMYTVPVNLLPGDTVSVGAWDSVMTAKYSLGNNGVIIWPQSDEPGVQTLDTVNMNLFIENGVSITKPIELEKRFGYSPNPATGRLNLDFKEKTSLLESVRLYDLAGRTHWISTKPVDGLDLNGFPRGLYLLEVRYSDKVRGTFKLLFQ